MINRLFILLIVITLVGCSGEHEATEPTIEEVTSVEVEKASQEPKIDVTTEVRHAYIKEITTYKSALYIKVDYADYFTGEEAMKAAFDGKAYFIDGDETIVDVLDNYYVSNINNKLRTFKLQENISIELIRTDDDVYDLEEKKIGSESQLRMYMDDEDLIILHIEDGIVTGIEEQFFP